MTPTAGQDMFYADSTAHRLKMSNNGGTADTVAGAATTDTFTNKTFDTAGSGNSFSCMVSFIASIMQNVQCVVKPASRARYPSPA